MSLTSLDVSMEILKIYFPNSSCFNGKNYFLVIRFKQPDGKIVICGSLFLIMKN